MAAHILTSASSHPPADEDLLDLYNQVLAGFAADSPTTVDNSHSPTADGELASIYNSYSEENGADPPSYERGPHGASLATGDTKEPIPSPAVASTAQGRGARSRPLPLPPSQAGASQSTAPAPMLGMPEPQVYSHPQATKLSPLPTPPPPPPLLHSTTHPAAGPSGYSAGVPRRASAGVGGLRRLPQAPTASALSPNDTLASGHDHRSYGLPADPRPDYSPQLSKATGSRQGSNPLASSSSLGGSGSGSRQSTPAHPYATATPIADTYSSSSPTWSLKYSTDTRSGSPNGRMTDLTRSDSGRPKGALAPSIPGQGGMLDVHVDSLAADTGDYFGNGSSPAYQSRMPESHRAVATQSPATPASSLPQHMNNKSLPGSPSRIELEQHYRGSSDDLRGAPYGSSSANVGRTTSTGSHASSLYTPKVDPASGSSASSSMYTNGDTVILGPSSGTTVDRGNSVSSFASAHSANSAIGYYDSHQMAAGSSSQMYTGYDYPESSSNPRANRANGLQQAIAIIKGPLELHEEDELDYYDEYEEDDENRFFNLALLSHIAVRLRDKVPRGTHVKGGIPYPRAFTGKDIVSTIQAQIQRELLINLGISTTNRRPALQVARSLQSQLFFYEVEWGGRVLQDGVEDVYMFLDDQEGGADARPEREELPTGVVTLLTKCYASSCVEGSSCYVYACPRRQREVEITSGPSVSVGLGSSEEQRKRDWGETIDKEVLRSLPDSEISRQTIIHKAIEKEQLYVQDLDMIESAFMKPIRNANPALIAPEELDSFMEDVFGNVLDLRECNRRLLEVMAVRQREQSPIIQRIGDVFLTAAAEFRWAYPIYVGNLPVAEKRLKDEIERNLEFRRFLDQCSRQPEMRRMDLKTLLNRPSEHLQKYPVLFEAIFNETVEENPDADFLQEAIQAIRKLSTVAQLRTFQSAMGKGPTGKLDWHDLVPPDVRASVSKQEAKRQSIIFELIKGEMAYVRDLENIETMYIRPLQTAIPPIIPRERLNSFLQDVFYNYAELRHHHRRLLEKLHEIQREEHPFIRSVTPPLFDAALNFRDAYMEYVPHYPIAWYRIDEEIANNPLFKAFAESTLRHPDSRKLDMKNFVNRPIPRLLRYELLLSGIMAEAPPDHEDKNAIPQVIEVIKELGKETEPGVRAAEERVEIWRYNQNLIFKPGEAIDMDLLDENRSLVHSGKLLRQPDTGFEWSGWTELFVLLFDNYLVMSKPKEKDGATKYHVNRRPIPLDLLTLVNFTDPPQQRGKGILGGLRGGGPGHVEPNGAAGAGAGGPDSVADARAVYPCTIHHNGRLGGVWTVYAETAQARTEWKQKLEEAILLRKVVTDANKVFEIETLSSDTFLVPSMHAGASNPSWNDENTFTGKVTCSVPFSTSDGRGLVAIGCAEGVWIGLRHDPRSMRRVLHLKMVTQCAMLEDFGIFLVLADKALFAYHIEALVPSTPPSTNATRTPQKLNGNRDVQFFSVGTLGGRTLIIYMKKKGLDSVFRVLEPVVGKIAEKTKAPGGLSRFGFGSQRSEWFRVFRDFFLPSESYDLIFLKAKIAILCAKGFEIMDLTDFQSVTIPQRDDPRLQALAKRCESCRPMGMFRSNENEFLLCYDEFGLYVNRHGDPSRTVGTIEWEGTAERVAWHPPYILLFDSRFIEVRHVETGRLAQIIPGNDVRCLWDGRGAAVPPMSTPGPDGWQDSTSQEPRVHAVMKASEPPGPGPRSSRAVAQHVFQLVPTIPLYLPGSLTSPSNSTYFPQTSSPPHSPQLTPRHSYR